MRLIERLNERLHHPCGDPECTEDHGMRWQRRCNHMNTRCLHGDEIWHRLSWWRGKLRRQVCLDCGRALDRNAICLSIPGQHEWHGKWHPNQGYWPGKETDPLVRRACLRFHPDEPCQPGSNHPAANWGGART